MADVADHSERLRACIHDFEHVAPGEYVLKKCSPKRHQLYESQFTEIAWVLFYTGWNSRDAYGKVGMV